MPGMIIGGEEILIPGIPATEQPNYKDHPALKLRMGEDMRMRKTRWIRSVVAHNTKNRKTTVAEGKGPETHLENRIARLWSTDGRHAGAHVSIDWDGTIACHADLLLHAAYHAGLINDPSVGFELYEDSAGKLYDYQLQIAVAFTEFVTGYFQIQRQCPPSVSNKPIKRAERGGQDLVGVLGHCHALKSKPDDPGIHYFEYLEKAGFEVMNFWVNEDIYIWQSRQQHLGFDKQDVDGIPGPRTVDALQLAGYVNGIWRVTGKNEDSAVRP